MRQDSGWLKMFDTGMEGAAVFLSRVYLCGTNTGWVLLLWAVWLVCEERYRKLDSILLELTSKC